MPWSYHGLSCSPLRFGPRLWRVTWGKFLCSWPARLIPDQIGILNQGLISWNGFAVQVVDGKVVEKRDLKDRWKNGEWRSLIQWCYVCRFIGKQKRKSKQLCNMFRFPKRKSRVSWVVRIVCGVRRVVIIITTSFTIQMSMIQSCRQGPRRSNCTHVQSRLPVKILPETLKNNHRKQIILVDHLPNCSPKISPQNMFAKNSSIIIFVTRHRYFHPPPKKKQCPSCPSSTHHAPIPKDPGSPFE